MRDFLALYAAFFMISLASQPLFGLHIILTVSLAFLSRQVVARKTTHAWLMIGLCTVSLLTFCAIEWFSWGLYDYWSDQHLLWPFYVVSIISGTLSGWLLYQSGWWHRQGTHNQRRWGHVLGIAGALVWSVAFQVTFWINTWFR